MTPQVSVIIPVRNGARWLGEAIKSIQYQTLPDFELIIIDDGSTDDSPHIIAACSRGDSRIRAIRQDRLGLVAALNRGLTASIGPLIARLDADDIAYPQRLERQSRYLERHADIGLLGTWAEKIDEQCSVRGKLTPPTQPDELAALLTRTNPFLHSSIMMRRTVLQAVGPYRAAFEAAEDYDLWLRMSEVTRIANLPEYLLKHRIHPASVSHSASVRQLFSARLAQRAAQSRRANESDPTSELKAPPNWHAAQSGDALIYADLRKLFCLLDLADSSNIPITKGEDVDISPLSDRDLVLNHAERRMAQLAVLNLLRNPMSNIPRTALLRHFIQLHPLRAISFGYRAFWKSHGLANGR